MLSPKRTKFRKFHRKMNPTSRFTVPKKQLAFGTYGLKSLQFCRLNARAIEAARRTLTRHFKRNAKIWIRVFPHISVSAKPIEVRMGKGKGAHSYWAAFVRPGQLLFEFDGVDLQKAQEAARLAAAKLPMKTQFVVRS